MKFSTIRVGPLMLALALAGACGDGPTAPTPPSALDPSASVDSSAQLLGLFGPRPLYCPNSETEATTAVLDGLGGALSLAGTTVSIPAGALLGPTTITLTRPVSSYLEIDISVEGTEHFLFELPITVTVSYGHCSLGFLSRLLPLSAWYWEPETRTFLERMPSLDNKLARTVTFTTPHLSGYIIAN
jgi:hypothetical protein